ncbi:type IV inositol polyphosphate 5-phosphatase 3-like isoform X2 [Mangifera indica]|uniref:type IV inositol polyphosphate 5-phosphatase 3-like isoform X2 n=1 Tax=Mangifera indica TaxID=29780 RepID=UPI001CFB008B|nr:type IV inositol polyphosphate 5-phosphatase 3-like isoform X2 [Mangifera indica]
MKPKHSSKPQPERSWAELCCCLDYCSCLQLFWPRVVLRKWFNITAKDSDYSADTDEEDDYLDADSNTEEIGQSRLRVNKEEDAEVDPNDPFPRLRRRKSETFRAQYINTKELRICVGTWNVGGNIPTDDLDIDDWVDINDPADIYVLGLQEIVPLNAGNIFGAEDSRPVQKWENVIRDTLSRIRPASSKLKSFSDPPSPSKFKPADDIPDIEEEVLLESDSDVGEEVYPLDEETKSFDEVKEEPDMAASYSMLGAKVDMPVGQDIQKQFSSPKKLDRLNCLRTEDSEGNVEALSVQNKHRLTKMLSGSERIGLCWPEPPLNLVNQNVLERPNSFKSIKSFKTAKSLRAYSSFKSVMNDRSSGIALLAEIDLESLMKRKRRSSYVRIVSKQMVGIFITVWVRRSLRRHIQNVRVSTVGVGVMGYIGNKGSISVSMSIYQTLFCFICAHLTSGEKEGDEQKRNADVYEILRRTRFYSQSEIGLPKCIYDHERIIWLGDLNYRINLPYEKTRELISKKDWSKLMEKDQLIRELRRGHPFDGWYEGTLNFPPTYKYELSSGKYYGEDPKAGRRTPAWCDRILSYGKGMRLLKYKRAELKLSDHRPVTATYMAEVEEFSHKKLQRALTITDAEIENEEVIADLVGIDVGLSNLRLDLEALDLDELSDGFI